MSNATNELKQALKQGYLLHGSSQILLQINPRKANPINGDGGKQLAVYASNILPVAVWMGLSRSGNGTFGYSWDDSTSERKFYAHGISFGPGYVYILPKESFLLDPEKAEFISAKPVVPLKRIRITFQDFLELQSEYDFELDIR